MKKNPARKWLVAVLLVSLSAMPAAAQNKQAGVPATAESATPQLPDSSAVKPVTATTGQNEVVEPGAKSPSQPCAGVGEILKLLQAGVSKEVMMSYIESAEVTPPPSAADIVTLKEHNVPDDVTVALIKRGAEQTAQENQARAGKAAKATFSSAISLDALVAALRNGQSRPGHLDPEGYDYFRYYYLQPRSIAAANERLYSYPPYAAYPPYGPGYSSPWGTRPGFMGPQFPGGW